MNFDERTNRLIRELAAQGVELKSDERTSRLVGELAAEKQAQLEGAKAVLKPLAFIAAIIMFVVSFWRYEIGLPLSIGAALLTFPAVGLGLALPIGYVLGKRAARRFKRRISDAG